LKGLTGGPKALWAEAQGGGAAPAEVSLVGEASGVGGLSERSALHHKTAAVFSLVISMALLLLFGKKMFE